MSVGIGAVIASAAVLGMLLRVDDRVAPPVASAGARGATPETSTAQGEWSTPAPPPLAHRRTVTSALPSVRVVDDRSGAAIAGVPIELLNRRGSRIGLRFTDDLGEVRLGGTADAPGGVLTRVAGRYWAGASRVESDTELRLRPAHHLVVRLRNQSPHLASEFEITAVLRYRCALLAARELGNLRVYRRLLTEAPLPPVLVQNGRATLAVPIDSLAEVEIWAQSRDTSWHKMLAKARVEADRRQVDIDLAIGDAAQRTHVLEAIFHLPPEISSTADLRLAAGNSSRFTRRKTTRSTPEPHTARILVHGLLPESYRAQLKARDVQGREWRMVFPPVRVFGHVRVEWLADLDADVEVEFTATLSPAIRMGHPRLVVRDVQNGTTLQHAEHWLDDNNVVLGGLPRGQCEIETRAHRAFTQRTRVTIGDAATEAISIELVPKIGLEIAVHAGDGPNPGRLRIFDLERARWLERPGPRFAIGRDLGRYTLDLSPGRYAVIAEFPDTSLRRDVRLRAMPRRVVLK